MKFHKEAILKGEKTRAHMFVTLWQKYIDQGMEQEDAYRKVDAEFQEVETRINAEQDAEIVKQLRACNEPHMKAWYEEEDKYVQEAVDYHKSMFYAGKKKALDDEHARQQVADAPDDKDTERLMKKKPTRGGGKKK